MLVGAWLQVAEDGDLLSSGRLPQALRWFAQAASAVAHAHAHGAVHGQLRPEHVLLACDEPPPPPSPQPHSQAGSGGGGGGPSSAAVPQTNEPTVRLLGFEAPLWREYKHGALESAGEVVAAPSPDSSPPRTSTAPPALDIPPFRASAALLPASAVDVSDTAAASSSAVANACRRLPLHRPIWAHDAPELLGCSNATLQAMAAADVWALGVLLTCMLAGQPPTAQSSAKRTAAAMITTPASPSGMTAVTAAASELSLPCTAAAIPASASAAAPAASTESAAAQPTLSIFLPPRMTAAPQAVLELVRSMLDPEPSRRPSASVVKARADALVMPPPARPIGSSPLAPRSSTTPPWSPQSRGRGGVQ